MQVPPPIPPAAPLPPRIKQGGYMICTVCKLAEDYCGCAKAPSPPPPTGDGVDSDLNRRIRTLKGAP